MECQLAEECWIKWQLSHVISMLKGLRYVRQSGKIHADITVQADSLASAPRTNAKRQFIMSSQASRVGECCNNSPMCWKPLVFNPVRGINKPQSTCWQSGLELWNASDWLQINSHTNHVCLSKAIQGNSWLPTFGKGSFDWGTVSNQVYGLPCKKHMPPHVCPYDAFTTCKRTFWYILICHGIIIIL